MNNYSIQQEGEEYAVYSHDTLFPQNKPFHMGTYKSQEEANTIKQNLEIQEKRKREGKGWYYHKLWNKK